MPDYSPNREQQVAEQTTLWNEYLNTELAFIDHSQSRPTIERPFQNLTPRRTPAHVQRKRDIAYTQSARTPAHVQRKQTQRPRRAESPPNGEVYSTWYPNPKKMLSNLPGALWQSVKFIGKTVRPPDIGGNIVDWITGKDNADWFTQEQKLIATLGRDVVRSVFPRHAYLREAQRARAEGRPVDLSKEYTALVPAIESYAKLSPLGPEGTRPLARHLEEEPDILIDLALSGAGIGAGIMTAKGIARGGRILKRSVSRAITPFDSDIFDPVRRAHVDIDILGRRQWSYQDWIRGNWGQRELLSTGQGTHIGGGEISTALHVIAGTEAANPIDLSRASVVLRDTQGRRTRAKGIHGLSPEADLTMLYAPNIQTPALNLLDIPTPEITAPRIRSPYARAELGRSQLVGQEGMSGASMITETGEYGMYLGELHGEGLFTTRQTLIDFQATERPFMAFRDLDTSLATQNLERYGLHYRHSRRHSGISTGQLTAKHVFRFFDPAERQRILSGGKKIQDYTPREAVDLLKDHYPDAESLQYAFARGMDIHEELAWDNASSNIFFRSRNPSEDTLTATSTDSLLSRLYSEKSYFKKDLQREARDAFIDPEGLIKRRGVFAGSYDEALRYLGGMTTGYEGRLEGGHQFTMLRGDILPQAPHLLSGSEYVVKPREIIYAVAESYLKKQEGAGFWVGNEYYPNQKVQADHFEDAPAELFAVDPRRRYLQQERPFGLQLHSGLKKWVRDKLKYRSDKYLHGNLLRHSDFGERITSEEGRRIKRAQWESLTQTDNTLSEMDKWTIRSTFPRTIYTDAIPKLETFIQSPNAFFENADRQGNLYYRMGPSNVDPLKDTSYDAIHQWVSDSIKEGGLRDEFHFDIERGEIPPLHGIFAFPQRKDFREVIGYGIEMSLLNRDKRHLYVLRGQEIENPTPFLGILQPSEKVIKPEEVVFQASVENVINTLSVRNQQKVFQPPFDYLTTNTWDIRDLLTEERPLDLQLHSKRGQQRQTLPLSDWEYLQVLQGKVPPATQQRFIGQLTSTGTPINLATGQIEGTQRYPSVLNVFGGNPRRAIAEAQRMEGSDFGLQIPREDTGLNLHSGQRRAAEHFLRQEYFESAARRGTLSGDLGRYGGELYFSSGPHYRGSAGGTMQYGFFFDPDVLQQKYGAVPTEERLDAILGKLYYDWRDPAYVRLNKVQEQLIGETRNWKSNQLIQPERRQAYLKGLGWGLEDVMRYQEKYDLHYIEPEFTTTGDVDLRDAIGVATDKGIFRIEDRTLGLTPSEWYLREPTVSEIGEPSPFKLKWDENPNRPLILHSQRQRNTFGLPQRLATHYTSEANYKSILERRAILSGKTSGTSIGMYNVDRYAGDDQYVFLGKNMGSASYGDYGLMFPAKRLINRYDALVSDTDLYFSYKEAAETLTEEWHEERLFPSTFTSRDDPFSLPDFREAFKQNVEFYQDEYRQYGINALDLFDNETDVEILVPNQVPISEAVAVVEANKRQLILPETRGPDPNRWQLDQFPNRLNLHGRKGKKRYGRQTLLHATHPDHVASILEHGLDPSRTSGKIKENWLFTPSRADWAREHIHKKHGIPHADVPIIEAEVDRSQLTRRWRGIWSTPEHIPAKKLKLHAERYLSEHMLMDDYYHQAVERGYLSGKFGHHMGALYWSEGAHYRRYSPYGFFFDPNVLEKEFGAVASPSRLAWVFRKLGEERDAIGPTAQAQRLGEDFRYGVLSEIWREQTGNPIENVWDTNIDRDPKAMERYVSQVQRFRDETGVGLHWINQQQRHLKLLAEPEFITLQDIPIDRAAGFIAGEAPRLFTKTGQTRSVLSTEYGGLEPGTFVRSEDITRSIRLHSGDLSQVGRDFQYGRPSHPLTATRRIKRWYWEQSGERAWGRYTQNAFDIAKTGAVISTAAQATVQAIRGAVGHDIEIGAFLRAGAEIGAAIGINRLDRRFGYRDRLPEEVRHFDPRTPHERRMRTLAALPPEERITAWADMRHHLEMSPPNVDALRELFVSAGASGRWTRASLSNEISRRGGIDYLRDTFGEESALYIAQHADVTRRFGQRSHQTKRSWGETIMGLASGDFGQATRYIYDPHARSVTPTKKTRLSIDSLLERHGDRHILLSAWRERRTEIRAGERTDWLGKIGLPLQHADVEPGIGYMFIPSARGIGRFFNRYIASRDPEHQWLKGKTIEDFYEEALVAGGNRTRGMLEGYRHRKALRAERESIFEDRRLNPSLYEWQDPQHFFESMATRIGATGDLPIIPRQPMLTSPYSKWRLGTNIPQKYKYPLIGAGAAGAGYLTYEMFTDDEHLTLDDPANYSLSPRFPILGAIQRTLPYRRLRARAETLVDATYGEGTMHSEMLKSIVLGKKRNLPQDVKDTFVQTGQIHALVQSGMHINMFGGLLSRYPVLALPAVASTLRDTVAPPDETVITGSDSLLDKYKLSASPWIPRWNPERPSSGEIWYRQQLAPSHPEHLPDDYQVDFSKPFWAWWDPKAAYEKSERYRSWQKGKRLIPNGGYLYEVQHGWTDKRYIGISTRDPEAKTGRIHKHLTGRGSKAVAAELTTGGGQYTSHDFVTRKWHYPKISYFQLGELERERIAQFDTQNTGYNRSPGGEIHDPEYEYQPPPSPTFVDSKTRLRDIIPWATYTMFGVLPEAAYTYATAERTPRSEPQTAHVQRRRDIAYKRSERRPEHLRRRQEAPEMPDPQPPPVTDTSVGTFRAWEADQRRATASETSPHGGLTEQERILTLLSESDLSDQAISEIVDRVLEELELRNHSNYTTP